MVTPVAPYYDIVVKERPAQRLHDLMIHAKYKEPAEFFIKAMDVFERALSAGGKVIVENEKEGKRYIFTIVNQ